ncbi:MAG: hypothetical protein D6812_08660 [Deltaproteobacteria bacterium]|nr:MAG: hypothetical protein D6812_08660 [Deltaproteobacteria bacterium]
MLDAVPKEFPQRSIVHPDRDLNGQFAVTVFEETAVLRFEVDAVRGPVDLQIHRFVWIHDTSQVEKETRCAAEPSSADRGFVGQACMRRVGPIRIPPRIIVGFLCPVKNGDRRRFKKIVRIDIAGKRGILVS